MKMVTVGSRTPKQHTVPCDDCPWKRDSIPGWLGNMTIEEWLRSVHGETRMDCHVHLPHQCVGAAIYRANVCKRPRDGALLRVPQDKDLCFKTPDEFTKHHDPRMLVKKKPKVGAKR